MAALKDALIGVSPLSPDFCVLQKRQGEWCAPRTWGAGSFDPHPIPQSPHMTRVTGTGPGLCAPCRPLTWCVSPQPDTQWDRRQGLGCAWGLVVVRPCSLNLIRFSWFHAEKNVGTQSSEASSISHFYLNWAHLLFIFVIFCVKVWKMKNVVDLKVSDVSLDLVNFSVSEHH